MLLKKAIYTFPLALNGNLLPAPVYPHPVVFLYVLKFNPIANGDENLADYLETVNVLCHRRYAGISPDVDTGP